MQKHLSIVGFGYDRDNTDYYPTPRSTTYALMKREQFSGSVWECASGDGRMAKVIEQFNKCYSSDIRKDASIYGDKGVDFLKTFKQVDNIITNPPYRFAKEFVEHSLVCSKKKVAMLLKLVFLEGVSRYEMFKNSPLKTVHVFCKRQKIYKQGVEGKNSGLIAYAWFIWDKSYDGRPYIDWIKI